MDKNLLCEVYVCKFFGWVFMRRYGEVSIVLIDK